MNCIFFGKQYQSFYCLSQVHSLEREIELHRGLCHPTTVDFYEAMQTPTEVFIVMSIAGDCDLVDYIVNHGRLKEHQVPMARPMSKGLLLAGERGWNI